MNNTRRHTVNNKVKDIVKKVKRTKTMAEGLTLLPITESAVCPLPLQEQYFSNSTGLYGTLIGFCLLLGTSIILIGVVTGLYIKSYSPEQNPARFL